jgi:hypothetical protein
MYCRSKACPPERLWRRTRKCSKKYIDKIVGGAEPFREGYATKLRRDKNGKLHFVDGHHRAAMYSALGKAVSVRIMDGAAYTRLTGGGN